jgi:hypothetical protein
MQGRSGIELPCVICRTFTSVTAGQQLRPRPRHRLDAYGGVASGKSEVVANGRGLSSTTRGRWTLGKAP